MFGVVRRACLSNGRWFTRPRFRRVASAVVGRRMVSASSTCAAQQPEPATAVLPVKQQPCGGVFGCTQVFCPADFPRQAKEAVAKCVTLVEQMLSPDHEPGLDTLKLVDLISDTVCRVADAAETCRTMSSDPEWEQAATEAMETISGFVHQLNTLPGVGLLLKNLVNDEAIMATLTPEQQRVAHLHDEEFRLCGTALPEKDRKMMVQLQVDADRLKWQFVQNSHNDQRSTWVDVPRFDVAEFPGFKRYIADHGDADTLSVDPALCPNLVQQARDPAVRKSALIHLNTQAPENIQVLDNLVSVRNAIAATAGFESYADLCMESRMLSSVDQVLSFLHSVEEHARPLADAERAVLSQLKMDAEGSPVIHQWDRGFYQNQARSANAASIDKNIGQYFTLDIVLNGVTGLLEEMFGLEMRRQEPLREERWTDSQVINAVFVDPYNRPGKYASNVMHTIQCGREFHAPFEDLAGCYQMPTLVLSCSVNAGHLLFSQARNVFHEFGHGLHSLLCRCQFQHTFGTRVPIDFVEIPSTLMEHFFLDYRVLSRFAQSQGQTLPQGLLEEFLAQESQWKGINTQFEVALAMFDLLLHSGDKLRQGRSVEELWRDVSRDECGHWFSTFSHLSTYGAGYYSYLVAKAGAATLWEECFEQDPFDSEVANKYQRVVLAPGGGKDPKDMLSEMLGGGPILSVEALMRTGQAT